MSQAHAAPLSPILQREFAFTDDDFRFIADFIYRHTRIVLKSEKQPMVYSRLAKRVRHCKLSSFADYVGLVQSDAGIAEREELINAITTNLTSFFREKHHFDHMAKTALPALIKARAARHNRRLRIWSAGCSSGQEPYSTAMTLLDSVPRMSEMDVSILATDLDTHMVSLAKKGHYHAASESEIPASYVKRFTERDESGDLRMKDSLQDLVHFTKLNLHDPWPMQGHFDIIFCRNVVIYFDKETQARLFNRFADVLAPDGWLYIGHSESLAQVCERFVLVGRTIYVKKESPHAVPL